MTLTFDLLASIDALNSWVRAENRDWHSYLSPKYFIYECKRKVIESARNAGILGSRYIYTRPKCTSCKGSGLWNHPYDEWIIDDCRKCSGSGIATLYFEETLIAGRYRWHSPLKWPVESIRSQSQLEENWQTGQGGKPLQRIDVVRHLNVLEAAFGYGDYPLWLGSLLGSECYFCGAKNRITGMPVTPWHLQWPKTFEASVPICLECNDKNLFPLGLVTEDCEREWLRRRIPYVNSVYIWRVI